MIEELIRFKFRNPDPPGPGGRTIHAAISIGEDSWDIELRPDQPAVNPQPQGLNLRMQMVSDTLVNVIADAGGDWKNVTTEIDGDVDPFVRPYAADAQQAQIEVRVTNSGEITAQYLVTVKECSGEIAEAVPFQVISLPPGPEFAGTLLFDLRTDTAFAAGDTCTVELQALTGRIFESIPVTFPAPS